MRTPEQEKAYDEGYDAGYDEGFSDGENEAESALSLTWDLERRAADLVHYADKVALSARDNDPFLKDDIEAMERAIAKVKEALP
jgi:flagellar biosynthesis/type III secretory pathway protein FliH